MTGTRTVAGVDAPEQSGQVTSAAPDPRRWFTLAIVVLSVLIVALDTTVLNVAIPTILRDLDTTLPSLQWVITGYSLTFASLLIIGGRLADLFGARRMFIVGAALFGVGSLLASLAQSVPVLIVGEAIIEGIGASLMMPATLGILSSTFHGHERADRVRDLGRDRGRRGRVRTARRRLPHHRLLVAVVVPDQRDRGAARDPRRDALHAPQPDGVARGSGSTSPARCSSRPGCSCSCSASARGRATAGGSRSRPSASPGRDVWPTSRPVLDRPAHARCSRSCCSARSSRSSGARSGTTRTRCSSSGSCAILSFRYGLMTTVVLAMGQLGFLFVLPVFLQDGVHLSAVDNGLWLLPSGIVDHRRHPDRRPPDPADDGHDGRARRARARGGRPAADGARDLAVADLLVAGPGPRGVRPRDRLRGIAADERDPLGDPERAVGCRQRREHHGAPARRRARHRGDRRRCSPASRSRTPSSGVRDASFPAVAAGARGRGPPPERRQLPRAAGATAAQLAAPAATSSRTRSRRAPGPRCCSRWSW